MLSSALSLAIGIFCIYFSIAHHSFERVVSHNLLVPPTELKYFTFGYSETAADTLWIRAIQDFDTCGKDQLKTADPVPASTDVVVRELGQRKGRCEKSWVYSMIDSVTELAPSFRDAYSHGGVMLSVAVDDVSGAAKIYDKAILRFPSDWQIAYKAAYHYLYEMGDRQRAAELLTIASKQPDAPYWLPILSARLYSKTGSAELGRAVLLELIAKNPDLAENEHIKRRMAEIERDLAAGDDVPARAPAPAHRPTTLPKKNL